MKKIVIPVFAIIIYFSISACGSVKPAIIASPDATSEAQFAAAIKTSLEVSRNGKIYEIVVGYDTGRAPSYSTPVGEFPTAWSESVADGAELESYADLDKDGESEIVVSKISCGTYCVYWLLIYEYDSANDSYIVADEIGADVKERTDINNDGIPEFIVYDGFCFRWCTHATQVYSALTILGYTNGKFSDETAKFPESIEVDAKRLLELSKTNDRDSAYITLPGYLFNMYRLGKIDEGRLVFDEVCNSVIKPKSSDCQSFRLEVEKSILEYKFGP
jgi:hypothetical protein